MTASAKPHKPLPSRSKPAAAPAIRRAKLGDLGAIQALLAEAQEPYRRASEDSLRRSLRSAGQSAWVVDGPRKGPKEGMGEGGRLLAVLVLWHRPRTLRIHDLATSPRARGQGLGGRLMAHAEALARRDGAGRIVVEAEEQDPRLVAWYEAQGFRQAGRIADYFHDGCSAIRLEKALKGMPG